MSVKESYDKYNESYNNIIKVLTDILDSKEVTEGSQALLEEAYVDYNTDYTNAISVLHGQKWEEENKKIKELEYKKLDANVENILNVLTKNGMYNSIYTDEEGRILIDMQSIPKLTLLVQKLSLIAKGLDGDDESSITIAPEFIELLSNSDIILRAKNILLEGLVTANGNFKILADGSIEATNGKFTGEINADSGKISSDLEVDGLNVSGNISTDTLTVRNINCANLLSTINSDINVTVDSTSPDINNTMKNGGIYGSLQKCISDIPKNLNGYIVTITVNSELSERIQVVGFNVGELRIQFNNNLNGFAYLSDNAGKVLLRGKRTTSQVLKYNYKTTGNLNMREEGNSSATLVQTLPSGSQLLVTQIDANNWGYTTYNGLSGWISLNTSYTEKEEVYETTGTSTAIIPDTLIKDGYHQSSIYVDNCSYVSVSNIEVYSETETDSYAIKGYRNSFVNLKNVKVNGSENGVIAQLGTRIYTSNMTGKVNSIATNAIMGSTIYIEDGTTINGTISNDNTSQVIYNSNNITEDTTSEVGTNTNTNTSSSIVTINSTGGDTYRSTVYNNWKKDNTVRQGDYGYGDCNGLWLFGDGFNKLKGKTITKLTVTVNRIQGGIYGNVTATLKMHGYSTKPSGMPTYTSGWSTSITTPINTTKTIEITDATVLNAISNGTCKGFGVQGAYDSSHYAVFDGNCTLTATIQ